MSAELYDPTTISMTAAAKAHLRKQLASEEARAVQLGITESGCNGYMYELTYTKANASDSAQDVRSFDFGENVRVLVDNAHWELVCGTEIDYVTEGLNSMLKFNNPNADSECGCGESFSIRGT